MNIQVQFAVFGLVSILAVPTVIASPHELHALERELAVIRATNQEIADRSALTQQLQLRTALDGVDARIENLTGRLNAIEARISDLAWYLAWFGTLITLVAGALALLGFVTGASRARATADEWLKANGNAHITATTTPLLESVEKRLYAGIESLRQDVLRKAHAEIDAAKKQWMTPMSTPVVETAPRADGSEAAASAAALAPMQDHGGSGRPAAREDSYAEVRAKAIAAFESKRFQEALELILRTEQLATTPLQKLQSRRSKSAVLYHLNRFAESLAALESLDSTTLNDSDEGDREMLVEIAKAHLGKAYTLNKLNQNEPAKKLLKSLADRFGDTSDEAFAAVAAEALHAMAYWLHDTNQHQQAIEAFRRLIDTFGTRTQIEFKRLLADAELVMALSLGETAGPDSEIEAYDRLYKTYSAEADEQIRATVAFALYNTGLVYERQAKKEAARRMYVLIDALYRNESSPSLVKTVGDARQRLRSLESS